MLNWHDRYSTLVSTIAHISIFHLNLTRIAPTPSGFLVQVKKMLECLCINCGRPNANIVSRSPAFLYSLRTPPHQIFWGPSLQVSWRTPNPHRCAVLDKRGVLPPAVQVVSCRSSDRRCGHCMHRVLVKWRAEQGVRRII